MPLAAHHCNVLRLVINAISQTYPNESLIKLLLTVTNIRELLGEGAGSPSCSYPLKTSGVAFKKVLATPALFLLHQVFQSITYEVIVDCWGGSER